MLSRILSRAEVDLDAAGLLLGRLGSGTVGLVPPDTAAD